MLDGFGFLVFTHSVPPFTRLTKAKAANMQQTSYEKLTYMTRQRKAQLKSSGSAPKVQRLPTSPT
jgi:hypothetical protein